MGEIVAVAGSAADEDAIEQLLDAAGIAYEIHLDADERGDAHRVCLLGRFYSVEDSTAPRAREVLRRAGREGLLIEPGER